MRKRWIAYPSMLALAAAGGLVAAPRATHAAAYDLGTCASGTTPTVISALQMQVRGATTNALPSAPVSLAAGASPFGSASDYGYVSYVNGLNSVFQPGGYNESSALFTYSATTATADSIDSGVAASQHTGTITFYAATGEAGNFANPSTFSSGTPVMTASFNVTNVAASPAVYSPAYTRQLYYNNFLRNFSIFAALPTTIPPALAQTGITTSSAQYGVGADFSSAGSLTITSATPFSLGGVCYQFGAAGTTLQWQAVGHLASPTGVNGAYTGVLASAGVVPTSF